MPDHELRDRLAAAFMSAHKGWHPADPILTDVRDARALAVIATTLLDRTAHLVSLAKHLEALDSGSADAAAIRWALTEIDRLRNAVRE
jgi:hypothetical protein